MTLMVDVSEAAARFDELLAEVEAGREVLIARGSEHVARVTQAVSGPSDVRTVVAKIRARKRTLPRTTMEEILQWKDEDRR